MVSKKPLLLMVLDGWGYRENPSHNAIHSASTPQWDAWWATCPHALLQASEGAVGLPKGQMGNSEVGHMHIGAGRVIDQDFTRINRSIDCDDFFNLPLFAQVFQDLTHSQHALHVMGLLSPGGVHSHEKHLFAFLSLCQQQPALPIYLHLFLDGRDTPPQSANSSLQSLIDLLKNIPNAQIASICGRYFAMDRDQRWDRTALVYQLLVEGKSAFHAPDALKALEEHYQQGLSDEFIPPTLIGQTPPVLSGDSVFFFNFRADRARQLTQAFIEKEFHGFSRPVHPQLAYFLSMTRYANHLETASVFPPLQLENTLPEIIAREGLHQLRIAETEKYAHVTFFLNGGKEAVLPNEDRILIPSPPVATYDLQPQMSAPLLTDTLIDAIKSQAYDVIICNYANADMVGHSGNFSATVKAIECLDQCMKKVWEVLKIRDGTLIITADHGNAELMYDETIHQAHTAHSSLPVPFMVVSNQPWTLSRSQGSLIDIAPTILTILGIAPPAQMTGTSLVVGE